MKPRWLNNAETQHLVNWNKGYARDPLGHWYFWDETGSAACGPYSDYEEARKALMLYADNL